MELGIGGLNHAREIGAGASARVYKAIQVDLDREVAVKVLSATDEAFVRRFRREARTLGKLSLNPGIVTVHGTGVTDSGQPYLILELCESSVLDHLKSEGKFDPEAACRVGAEIADAVSDAHNNGVVHRDIKPANLLRSQKGRYLITDFGISTVRDSTLGQTESIAFTVGYAAPETLRGEEAGTPSDVYALGATLFHMLAGQAPFVDKASNPNLMAFAQRVINDPTPDLRPLGIPDDVCRIVEGAMAKHPDDRPSAAQLRDQLLSVIGEGAPVAPPVEPGGGSTIVNTAAEPPAPVAPIVPAPPTAQASEAGLPDLGANTQTTAPGASVPPQKRLLADATDEPIPPGRPPYQLPPRRDQDGSPWKILLLGVLAGFLVLLVGVAIVLTQLGDGGFDVVDADPETPSASTTTSTTPQDSTPAEEIRTAEIPSVTGLTEDEASSQLRDDKFEVRVEERNNDDEAPGTVLSQDPAGGTEAEIGSVVTILVAATRDVVLIEVPTVAGLSRAEAEAALRDVGLIVGEPRLEFSDEPTDRVIGSEPTVGSSVDSTSPVTLIVSKGLEPPDCANLTGLTEAAATDIIEAAGLTSTTMRVENETVPDGQVVDCTASENAIDLVVSDGPEICGVVTGLNLAEGTSALEAKGYTVEATAVLRPNLTAGEIFACTKRDDTARISYAEGLPSECPQDSIGVPATDARTVLEALGFADVTIERVESDTVADGAVISCQVSGTTAALTVSSGPAVQTGTLNLTLTSLAIEEPCAGEGLQPDLFGSLSFSYRGDVKRIWANRLPIDARTPNVDGVLTFDLNRAWADVEPGGELVATWDLEDFDRAGRASDENGTNDEVSAATRTITATGADRGWNPSSDEDDRCVIRFRTNITWSGLEG